MNNTTPPPPRRLTPLADLKPDPARLREPIRRPAKPVTFDSGI